MRCARPDLFEEAAGRPGTNGWITARGEAENFNPYHDEQGRFTTGDEAVMPPGGSAHRLDHRAHLPRLVADGLHRHRERGELLAQRRGVIDSTAQKQEAAVTKEYHGKLSADAYYQPGATGICLPAIMNQAVVQLETMRTEKDEPLPKGARSEVRTIAQDINDYWEPKGYHFDFSKDTQGHGAAIEDGIPVLAEKFNIHSQPISIE